MRAMAVITSDKELQDRIRKVLEIFARVDQGFEPVFLDDAREALEFLKYELPEINIINFSDPRMDMESIIRAIKEDPWLHYGGIIAMHSQKDRKACVDALNGVNVIATLSRSEFVQGFFRILRILTQNRQIIYQRDLQAFLMKSLSQSLVMDNDPLNVRIYANLVSNYLYNMSYITADQRDQVHIAIHEMLMNAVEHGNCEITYEEKSGWLDTHGDILELIRMKNQDPLIKAKKVYFSYRISEDVSSFTIRDEGHGFDWARHVAKKDHSDNFRLHGRGIAMTGVYVEDLSYNDIGNEVSFRISHQRNNSNMLPRIFLDHDEVTFQDGDVIFREGENSNHLYYIVSGQVSIQRDQQCVSCLTPDDLFLGEMSFLLNNKRSATVVSKGVSVLVPVSKHSFVNIIKDQPHYGIFLARLLAHRLERMNTAMVDLRSERASLV